MKITHKIITTTVIVVIIQGCLNTISQSAYSDLVNFTSSYPKAAKCGECHVDIYQEWKNSKHAFSYSSKTFREATNDYRFKECLACHAPDSIFVDGDLQLRDLHKEEGITCVACHFQNGKFAGPIEHSALLLPHPVEVRSALYLSSELCGKCHQSVYKEWKTVSRKKKNCQECHMKEVVRKITQGTDFVSRQLVRFEKEGKLKRHNFHLSEIERLEGAIEATVVTKEKKPKTVSILITNKIPHSIPSGGFGKGRAVLTLTFLDAKENQLLTTAEIFYKELKTPLKTDMPWQKLFEVPTVTTFVDIALIRKNAKETTLIYENRLRVE